MYAFISDLRSPVDSYSLVLESFALRLLNEVSMKADKYKYSLFDIIGTQLIVLLSCKCKFFAIEIK